MPQCVYCQCEDNIHQNYTKMRNKAHKRRGYMPQTPICIGCFTLFLSGDPRMSNGGIGYHAAVAIKELKALAAQHKANADFLMVVKKVDEGEKLLAPMRDKLNEFQTKAQEQAQLLADLYKELQTAKQITAQKWNLSYTVCRQAANKTTADLTTRRRIFQRDGYACLECGALEGLSLDHIVPVIKGGSNEDSNLQTLCISCNCSKGSKCEAKLQ